VTKNKMTRAVPETGRSHFTPRHDLCPNNPSLVESAYSIVCFNCRYCWYGSWWTLLSLPWLALAKSSLNQKFKK